MVTTAGGDTDCETWRHRANNATATMLQAFWDGDHIVSSPRSSTIQRNAASYWITAEFIRALEDSDYELYGNALKTVVASRLESGVLASFYDDASWMATALTGASEVTGDTRPLQAASELMDGIRAGLDNCCGPSAGGVWWDVAHTQKATASNAGAAVAAVAVSQATEDASLLDFARTVLSYWNTTMVDANGHVTDHIDTHGVKSPWKFTYNEGLFISAALSLASANDSNAEALRLTAHRTAMFMVQNETVGNILDDGESCSGDCTVFKGPGFVGLLAAAHESKDPKLLEAVNISIEAVARNSYNASTGLYRTSWLPGSASSVMDVGSNIAAVMSLNKYYTTFCSPSTSGQVAKPSHIVSLARDCLLKSFAYEIQASSYSWAVVACSLPGNCGAKFELCRSTNSSSSRLELQYKLPSNTHSGSAWATVAVDQMNLPIVAVPPADHWTSLSFTIGREITSGCHRFELSMWSDQPAELRVDTIHFLSDVDP